MQRIGILTGGGDAPGLNAVIHAVVKTAHSVYGLQVTGIISGFNGLLPEGQQRQLVPDDVVGLLTRGGTIIATTNRGPFVVGQDGNPAPGYERYFQQGIEKVRELGIEALIVVGGDGSLSIARAFHRLGAPVVGVPKTIDNDLSATEVTFGFDTAVSVAADSLDRLHTVAEAHHRIMVCEVMGRQAGWIALHAGLASGADAILIPEIPFRWEPLCRMVAERRARGRNFSLMVAAEAARPVDGEIMYASPGRLGGIGELIAHELEDRTGFETRVTVLGHIQRGGTPTARDRVLASLFGENAVHLAARGSFGRMVALRADSIIDVPLDNAIDAYKYIPLAGQLIRLARSTGVFFGDEPDRR